MLVTEEEAKKKWCPKARAADCYNTSPVTVNRLDDGFPDPDCFCLASACMWWTWFPRDMGFAGPDAATRGFCGAAPPRMQEEPNHG